jgi:hypothetical protein
VLLQEASHSDFARMTLSPDSRTPSIFDSTSFCHCAVNSSPTGRCNRR